MKTLFIDMDEVICSFEQGVRLLKPDIIWNQENVNKVCLKHPRLFLELPKITGAKESLDVLSHYFDIYFASVPMWIVPESYMDKRLFLEDMFGDWVKHKLILTHNKGVLKGDFIVDDRTVHGVDQFQGKHIHFGTKEFPNWETVTNYLLKNK